MNFDKYFNQESTLPKSIEQGTNFELKFYAHIDLDENFKLSKGWIVLTSKTLEEYEDQRKVKSLDLDNISRLKEEKTLSGGILKIYEKEFLMAFSSKLSASFRLLALLAISHKEKLKVRKIDKRSDQ